MASLIVDAIGNEKESCMAVLLVPQQALKEPGYIRGMTESPGEDKHALQTLAQTAYYQYQDDELQIAELHGPCRISSPDGTEELVSGMIIYRSVAGAIRAAAHGGLNCKKLLEAAHRYCTRWVRLDI